MSAAFLKKGRKIRTIKIPDGKGKWFDRSAKTADKELVKAYQQMVDEFGPRGKDAQPILDTLITRDYTVPELYKLWLSSGRNMRRLRAKLNDVDVSLELEAWEKWVESRASGISADTAAHYIKHVRQGIPKGKPFLRSRFTSENIQKMLDKMSDSAPATVRKAGAGFSSAARFLRKRGVIKAKVMNDVDLPKAADPRDLWLETADALRLAEKQDEPYRTLSALMAGSGVEVSAALRMRRRDVDVKNREIQAPGTKNYNRNRFVRVADWAWPFLEARLKGLLPDARIFHEVPNRWRAGDVHRAAIGEPARAGQEATGLLKEFPIYRGYTMRDSRHTYAVRAVKAGTPLELVAKQLGHKDVSMVIKVYGKYAPRQDERAKWERIAAAQDAERKEEAK
jgi:integrase